MFSRYGGDDRIRTGDKGFADPRLNHLATSPYRSVARAAPDYTAASCALRRELEGDARDDFERAEGKRPAIHEDVDRMSARIGAPRREIREGDPAAQRCALARS
jgi:hypothetical protein